jgi:ADP-dependent NAD(P)H-hydrate dehydratase / NAD(P)H-hydrate epimerase
MGKQFDEALLRQLYTPDPSSHKGQNGKLLMIGGSRLFHAASIWSLQIASKLCDMVFYASVPENNEIVKEAKSEFRNGIVIRSEALEDYVQEADAILIGPGMMRSDNLKLKTQNSKLQVESQNLIEINEMVDEGEQTYYLTQYLFQKYPNKKWVIDGGALQMMEKEWLRGKSHVILTPHLKEFERLFGLFPLEEHVVQMAKEYGCVILRKGQEDIVASPDAVVAISGGNAGMTKGGTGDVLAGLVAALYTKNDAFLAASCGSYLNKKAGEYLFGRQGYGFNATDLVDAIPVVMKELVWEQ